MVPTLPDTEICPVSTFLSGDDHLVTLRVPHDNTASAALPPVELIAQTRRKLGQVDFGFEPFKLIHGRSDPVVIRAAPSSSPPLRNVSSAHAEKTGHASYGS